jgi:hypothetical protein
MKFELSKLELFGEKIDENFKQDFSAALCTRNNRQCVTSKSKDQKSI